MKKDIKEIYNLKLGESLVVESDGVVYETYTRVPGGWLCTQYNNFFFKMTSVFIPYDDEFKE